MVRTPGFHPGNRGSTPRRVAMKKLILFDIDKTLIEKTSTGKRPWDRAFKEVYGIETNIKLNRTNSHGMTHRQISIETLENNGLSKQEILEKLDEFFKVLEDIYEKALKEGEVIIFPKIKELLEALYEKGFVLGLVTGNTENIAIAKLRKVKIDKYFELGGFGKDSLKRSDLLKEALEKAKEKYILDDVFVVGDSILDIEAARDFNVKTIGVTTGLYSKEDLKGVGADFVLYNLENIDEFLNIVV